MITWWWEVEQDGACWRWTVHYANGEATGTDKTEEAAREIGFAVYNAIPVADR